jgi:hypothetical protein
MRWAEKSFFSKEAPSPKQFSLLRWLNRPCAFHRPGNSLSVDGMTGRKEVLKSGGFHPGRNYSSLDGA